MLSAARMDPATGLMRVSQIGERRRVQLMIPGKDSRRRRREDSDSSKDASLARVRSMGSYIVPPYVGRTANSGPAPSLVSSWAPQTRSLGHPSDHRTV